MGIFPMYESKNSHKQNSQKNTTTAWPAGNFTLCAWEKFPATTAYMDFMGMCHWHGSENKHQLLELPYILFVFNNTYNFLVLQFETFTKYLIV